MHPRRVTVRNSFEMKHYGIVTASTFGRGLELLTQVTRNLIRIGVNVYVNGCGVKVSKLNIVVYEFLRRRRLENQNEETEGKI